MPKSSKVDMINQGSDFDRKTKKEQYKKAMIEASKDELYIQDMKSIEDEFQYADEQILNPTVLGSHLGKPKRPRVSF